MAEITAMFSDYTCGRCRKNALDQGPEFYDAPARVFGNRWGIICYKCRYIAQYPGIAFDANTKKKLYSIDSNWEVSTNTAWLGQACPEEMEE